MPDPDNRNTPAGTGLLYHVFERYAPRVPVAIGQRINGVLVSNVAGKALAYSLFNLQERGRLFIGHGEPVYDRSRCSSRRRRWPSC